MVLTWHLTLEQHALCLLMLLAAKNVAYHISSTYGSDLYTFHDNMYAIKYAKHPYTLSGVQYDGTYIQQLSSGKNIEHTFFCVFTF